MINLNNKYQHTQPIHTMECGKLLLFRRVQVILLSVLESYTCNFISAFTFEIPRGTLTCDTINDTGFY